MNKFTHSVKLDNALCIGCINCLKRCPTQAIRGHNGKVHILDEFCIDCGACIRICSHHAKYAVYDPLSVLEEYEYTVAMPAPALFGQFNNLTDTNLVLHALLNIGFDAVYEVGAAAELVSEATRSYVNAHPEKWPIISTACPTITRLIRVRFPNLIDHLLPLLPPVEIAATLARKKAMEVTGLPPEKIGVCFLSPCPSKVTYVKSPLGVKKSEIDKVLAIKEIYPKLVSAMSKLEGSPLELSNTGKLGLGWGRSGGECAGLFHDNYLAADGISNVIQVLEDMEDDKFDSIEFIELNNCSGGCVGGVLTVENPYVASTKLKKIRKYLPVCQNHLEDHPSLSMNWTEEITYEPVFKLGNTLKETIENLNLVEQLLTEFPMLDCGACGAPTCRALAEDIVRGKALKSDCTYILRQNIHNLSEELQSQITGVPSDLDSTKPKE